MEPVRRLQACGESPRKRVSTRSRRGERRSRSPTSRIRLPGSGPRASPPQRGTTSTPTFRQRPRTIPQRRWRAASDSQCASGSYRRPERGAALERTVPPTRSRHTRNSPGGRSTYPACPQRPRPPGPAPEQGCRSLQERSRVDSRSRPSECQRICSPSRSVLNSNPGCENGSRDIL